MAFLNDLAVLNGGLLNQIPPVKLSARSDDLSANAANRSLVDGDRKLPVFSPEILFDLPRKFGEISRLVVIALPAEPSVVRRRRRLGTIFHRRRRRRRPVGDVVLAVVRVVAAVDETQIFVTV